VECLSCGLTLVSAPHLARSYHHLFPVKQFREVLFNGQSDKCYACQKLFSPESDKHVYFCELCEQFYCCDCDLFIHDTMHTCVGCNTIPGVQKRIALKVSFNIKQALIQVCFPVRVSDGSESEGGSIIPPPDSHPEVVNALANTHSN